VNPNACLFPGESFMNQAGTGQGATGATNAFIHVGCAKDFDHVFLTPVIIL
jgi:hypothetical protein